MKAMVKNMATTKNLNVTILTDYSCNFDNNGV